VATLHAASLKHLAGSRVERVDDLIQNVLATALPEAPAGSAAA
jgi:hypothetical protein